MKTEFTAEEVRVIREMLDNYLSELTFEIAGRDNLSVRDADDLVRKKSVVFELIGRMRKSAA